MASPDKENVPPEASHPYAEVTKISLLNIPGGTSPPLAHKPGNAHRNTADPQLDSLDNSFLIQSDSDRKDSDIEIEGPSEEPEVEIWQNTGGGFDMIMDYSPDGTSIYLSVQSH
jgi:hypothetical protein